MRKCNDVIKQMLHKIPESEAPLIEALTDVTQFDMSYQPPESVIQFEIVQDILADFIPQPTEDWEFEILSIFTTLSIEDLRKLVTN